MDKLDLDAGERGVPINLSDAKASSDVPVRRRLAENVIAIFADDRPPVVQPRLSGRHPKNVHLLRRYERLPVGCLAQIYKSSKPMGDANIGKFVMVDKQDGKEPRGSCSIKALDELLFVDNGDFKREAYIPRDRLRRTSWLWTDGGRS